MNINAINQYRVNKYNDLKNKSTEQTIDPSTSSEINFKGGKDSKVSKFFAEYYGKAMLNSDGVRNFCKKLSKGNASNHFQVVGSFVTSAAYMKATLDNKTFDKKNANTLAINQGLCFVLPTIAGYVVNSAMGNFNKSLEYHYSAMQEKQIALGKFKSAEEKKAAVEALGRKLKGFRTLLSIITFTTIYRYVSPVAITPLANWIGRKVNKPEAPKQEVQKSAGNIVDDMKYVNNKTNKISVAA